MMAGVPDASVESKAFPVPKPEPYVEFDFNTLGGGEGNMRLTIKVSTTHKDVTFSDESNGPRGFSRELLCGLFASGLKETGFKAEVVDKSKIRVYGCTREGKYYPATKGEATSPDLKKDELPKVKNPPGRDA